VEVTVGVLEGDGVIEAFDVGVIVGEGVTVTSASGVSEGDCVSNREILEAVAVDVIL
jgi:hypothetical protein